MEAVDSPALATRSAAETAKTREESLFLLKRVVIIIGIVMAIIADNCFRISVIIIITHVIIVISIGIGMIITATRRARAGRWPGGRRG